MANFQNQSIRLNRKGKAMKWFSIGLVLGWAIMSGIIGCNKENKEDDREVEKTRDPFFTLTATREKSDHSISYSRKSELLSLDVSVIEVQGCEYIVFYRASGGCIIHKQNCKFCKDREEKERKSVK